MKPGRRNEVQVAQAFLPMWLMLCKVNTGKNAWATGRVQKLSSAAVESPLHRRSAAVIFGLFVSLLSIAPASAQSPRVISIISGRGELLQFERDIERLAISEPKIADAVLVSPREVMVNGHLPGKASLI